MIKLFAWEGKVKEKMYEKREEELLWTKKRQFLQLLNMNAKYVLSPVLFGVGIDCGIVIFYLSLLCSSPFLPM